jgi:hypothetical protein
LDGEEEAAAAVVLAAGCENDPGSARRRGWLLWVL